MPWPPQYLNGKAQLERNQLHQVSQRMFALLEDYHGQRPPARQAAHAEESKLLNQPPPLTRLIVKSAGRVLTRHYLMERVWGYNLKLIMTRTVDAHMTRLREKLGPEAARQSSNTAEHRDFTWQALRSGGCPWCAPSGRPPISSGGPS